MSLPEFLKERKILAALIVVLIIGGAAAAYFFLLGEPSEPPPEDQIISKKVSITPSMPEEAGQEPKEALPAAKKEEAVKKEVPAKPTVKPVEKKEIAKKEVKPEAKKPVPGKMAVVRKEPPPAAAKEKIAEQWVAHMASFQNREAAEELKDKFVKTGLNAYVTEFTKDSVKWYRVRVGFYRNEYEARKAAKELSEKFGYTTAWPAKVSKNEASAHMK